MRLRTTRLLIVLAAIGVGILHGYLKEPPERRQVGYVQDHLARSQQWNGRYPADVELTLLDGSTFRMADSVGQTVVVLNFWATWCQPCREEMPELQRFVESRRDEPVRLVAVDAGEDEETVRAFLEREGIDLPVAIAGNDVTRRFGVASYPTTVVIGADGRIVLYEVGAILNAEVVLEPVVAPEVERIAAGEGVTREAYLAELEAQAPLPGFEEPEPRLAGRARAIAEEMTCPCGCSDKVWDCGCDTADRITAALEAMDLEGREDTEIITELNARFCVGAEG